MVGATVSAPALPAWDIATGHQARRRPGGRLSARYRAYPHRRSPPGPIGPGEPVWNSDWVVLIMRYNERRQSRGRRAAFEEIRNGRSVESLIQLCHLAVGRWDSVALRPGSYLDYHPSASWSSRATRSRPSISLLTRYWTVPPASGSRRTILKNSPLVYCCC